MADEMTRIETVEQDSGKGLHENGGQPSNEAAAARCMRELGRIGASPDELKFAAKTMCRLGVKIPD